MQIIQRVLELPRPFKIALSLFLTLVLLLLLFPWRTTIAPAWGLVVVDDAGQVVSDIYVTQHWQHYLLESAGHEEQRITNATGEVRFPERSIRSTVLGRVFARLRKIGNAGVAARTDPYASIVVWGSRKHQIVTAIYAQQAPPPNRMVVTRIGHE